MIERFLADALDRAGTSTGVENGVIGDHGAIRTTSPASAGSAGATK